MSNENTFPLAQRVYPALVTLTADITMAMKIHGILVGMFIVTIFVKNNPMTLVLPDPDVQPDGISQRI